jgi:hypothetical protein
MIKLTNSLLARRERSFACRRVIGREILMREAVFPEQIIGRNR